MTPNHSMSWEEAVRWFIDQPENVEISKAAYFDQPLEVAAKRYHASAEFAALRKYLPTEPGRALDLGAGNGILSYALAADGWETTAVEPDPSDFIGAGAIRGLSDKSKVKITVIEAFGEDLPLETAGFDVVVARQVLHHAADVSQFCNEMARLARPGGIIATLRDHVISGPDQMQPFLKKHPLHHLYGGENAFTLDTYRGALEGAGVNILNELKSFDSVVNYDPVTSDGVRRAISEKIVERLGASGHIAGVGLSLIPFKAVARLATLLDNRPGRLVSYICRKDQP